MPQEQTKGDGTSLRFYAYPGLETTSIRVELRYELDGTGLNIDTPLPKSRAIWMAWRVTGKTFRILRLAIYFCLRNPLRIYAKGFGPGLMPASVRYYPLQIAETFKEKKDVQEFFGNLNAGSWRLG